MQPTLAIEQGLDPEAENTLIQNAEELGWQILRVQHVPFTTRFQKADKDGYTTNRPVPDEDLHRPKTWYHGSIQGAKAAQTHTRWTVHAPWENLKCTTYYAKLRHLLQQGIQHTTLHDLKALITEPKFVRPNDCDKVFSGTVIRPDNYDEVYRLITSYDPPLNTQIVVAKYQKIIAEARFLIVNGVATTGSYANTKTTPKTIQTGDYLMGIAYKHLTLNPDYDPEKSWVLDLAQTIDGEWKILEVGASSCAGLYACDTTKFLQALQRTL